MAGIVPTASPIAGGSIADDPRPRGGVARDPSANRLDQLRSQLGVAFAHSSIAMLLVDEFTQVVCANHAAEVLLEVVPLIGRALKEFSIDSRIGPVAAALIRGELDHLEWENEFVTGSGRPLQMAVQVDAIVLPPGERHFLVQLTDTTDNRRREQELLASERRHGQVVGNLPDSSVIMFDSDLRVTLCSGEPLSTNGYPSGLTGTPLADVVPEGVVEILEGPFRAAIAGRGADFEYVSPVLGRQFRVRTCPVTNAEGMVVSGLAVMEDMSADRARRSQSPEADEGCRLGSRATDERIAPLRGVADALPVGRAGTEDLLDGVVKLAAMTIGEGAGIRILTADLQQVERDVLEHPDPEIRRRFSQSLQASAGTFDLNSPMGAEVIGRGDIISRLRTDSWKAEFAGQFQEAIIAGAHDFMVAPVRHNGQVLGLMTVFRTGSDNPYVSADEDVLQVFADAAGAALVESRVQDSVKQGRDLVRELSDHRKDLLDQLAVLETRERSLLAEAIHDEPIQVIVSAIMRLDFLIGRVEPEHVGELERIALTLEASVDWLRNLVVVALNPPDLTDGLPHSLKVLADGIFSGTATVFEIEDRSEEHLEIPSTEATYRVFREALVNVRNHAQARHVGFAVTKTDGGVRLSLTDDGVGTATLDAGPGHLGLATMQARARAEGGVLTIESSPGQGTTVSLTLPTRKSESHDIG